MFVRLLILLAIVDVVSGFMAPVNTKADLYMLFNFGKKQTTNPGATAVSKTASTKPVTSPAKSAPVKSTPVKPSAAKPTANSKFNFPLNPMGSIKSISKPTPSASKSTVSKAAPVRAPPLSSGFLDGLVGSDVEAPNFDPLQLSSGRSEETINWYRAAELKHGRIAMLAALGLSIQPAFHLPDKVFDTTLGYGSVTKLYEERPEAIWQILLALAAIETFSLFKNGQGSAGDIGFDPLNLREKLYSDPEKFAKVQLQELKHGRLAMWGSSALLLQEYVTGYGPYEQLLPH